MRLLQLRESAALLWALLLFFWCSIAAQIFGAISRVWWQQQKKKWGNTTFALFFFFFFFFSPLLSCTFIQFALFSHCAQSLTILSYSAAPLAFPSFSSLLVFPSFFIAIMCKSTTTTPLSLQNQCCSLREREWRTSKWHMWHNRQKSEQNCCFLYFLCNRYLRLINWTTVCALCGGERGQRWWFINWQGQCASPCLRKMLN